MSILLTISGTKIEFKGRTADGKNGDVASDQYHKYKEDIALMKSLYADYYR